MCLTIQYYNESVVVLYIVINDIMLEDKKLSLNQLSVLV